MKKRPRFSNNAVVINSQRTLSLTTEADESSVYESFPIACFLTGGKMHGQLSNAWDEYKIESVEITVTPSGTEKIEDEDERTSYIRFFTCIDNNRPPVNVSYSQLKANSTYSDTTFALHNSNTAPIHRTTFNMDQRYTSTKTTSPLGTLTLGLASSETFDEPVTTWWSCNFRFHVSYRKARVDTGYITTMIPSSMPEISGAGLACKPPGKQVINCITISGATTPLVRFGDFVKITTATAVTIDKEHVLIYRKPVFPEGSSRFTIHSSGNVEEQPINMLPTPGNPTWYAVLTGENVYNRILRFGEYIEDEPGVMITKIGIDPLEIHAPMQYVQCYLYEDAFDIQGFA